MGLTIDKVKNPLAKGYNESSHVVADVTEVERSVVIVAKNEWQMKNSGNSDGFSRKS